MIRRSHDLSTGTEGNWPGCDEVAVTVRARDGTVDTTNVHPALNEVVLAAFDDLSNRPYSTVPDWNGTPPP